MTESEAVDQIEQNFDQFDKDKNGALSWFELSLAGQRSEAAKWMRNNLDEMSKLADTDEVTMSGRVTPRLQIFQDEHPASQGVSKYDIRAAKFILGEFHLNGK
jgi:hypothetical protein